MGCWIRLELLALRKISSLPWASPQQAERLDAVAFLPLCPSKACCSCRTCRTSVSRASALWKVPTTTNRCWFCHQHFDQWQHALLDHRCCYICVRLGLPAQVLQGSTLLEYMLPNDLSVNPDLLYPSGLSWSAASWEWVRQVQSAIGQPW